MCEEGATLRNYQLNFLRNEALFQSLLSIMAGNQKTATKRSQTVIQMCKIDTPLILPVNLVPAAKGKSTFLWRQPSKRLPLFVVPLWIPVKIHLRFMQI